MKRVGELVAIVAISATARGAPAQGVPTGPPPAGQPAASPPVTNSLTAGQPAAGTAGPLSLDEAIQLAMTRNERARIAELDIVVADAAVSRAKVAFLPVLSANGNDTLHPRDKPLNTTNGALTLNQPLIEPSAWPLLAEAEHNRTAQLAQSTDDRRQLSFDAAKAFLNAVLAEEVVKAAQRKLDTSKADLADTDAQVRAQLVSSNDVTRAQIELAGSVRELASDQGSLESANVQLAFVINAPVAPAARELTMPAALLDAGARPLPAIDTLVSASLAKRPDLAARKDSALAAHDFAREPRLRWLPTLSLQGQLTASGQADRSGHDVSGTVALTASWDLFDGGARWADARSRDAQAEIADLNTDALIRSIDAQVRSAAASLITAQQALAAAGDAMTASRKSADETAILYHQQLAKAIELLDANEQRFAAEVNYAVAQVGVASAYLALRQAMGLDPLGTELR